MQFFSHVVFHFAQVLLPPPPDPQLPLQVCTVSLETIFPFKSLHTLPIEPVNEPLLHVHPPTCSHVTFDPVVADIFASAPTPVLFVTRVYIVCVEFSANPLNVYTLLVPLFIQDTESILN